MRTIVLTDLDGTLLDAHTYDWSPARPALAALRERDIPVMFCTSKTRAELESLRRELDHHHPFSIENGAAIHVPVGYFGQHVDIGVRRNGHDVIEMGLPSRTLIEALQQAAVTAGVTVRGWHLMDLDEIAERCEMPIDTARRAAARDYGEPFVIEDRDPASVARLEAEIVRLGARLTRGDRFFHILGPHDKGTAARALITLFERAWGPVTTIAIGDAPNDVPMLAIADTAIVIASPLSAAVAARVPGARQSAQPGPAGWNAELLDVLGA